MIEIVFNLVHELRQFIFSLNNSIDFALPNNYYVPS